MRSTCLLFMLLTGIALIEPASAGVVSDRVKATNTLRCGAESRPGLYATTDDGHASGMLLDICRAMALTMLGPEGRIIFTTYESELSYAQVRDGKDDVFFLTASEMVEHGAIDKVLPGPPVYFVTSSIMVPVDDSAKTFADLKDKSVCYEYAINADHGVDTWFGVNKVNIMPMGFREPVELYDTYNSRACHALAGEVTTLASVRLNKGVNNITSRILDQPLTVTPLVAATPQLDPQWSAFVSWAVSTLEVAEIQGSYFEASGLRSMPVPGDSFGLPGDWQTKLVAGMGTYADMYRRNLGEDSPLKLPRGLNAPYQMGGLFLPPIRD